MEIRKFKSSDRKSLLEFWALVFPGESPHNEPALVIEKKLKVDDLIFVVCKGDSVIASCMTGYDGHRGWLYSVAVHPDFRRNGLGTKVVEFAMSSLKELGCIKVNLQIRETNKALAVFYISLGFDIEERLSMGCLLK